MEGSTQSPSLSLEFSIRELAQIRLVHVIEVGLQVHKGRWQRIQSVVGQGYRLCVLHFRESLEVEAKVTLGVVALGSCDVRSVRHGLAGPEAHAGVVSALGN